MKKSGQSRVIGLLGVGFDTEDDQIRVTKSDQFQILMGSQESHKALQKLCLKIERVIQESGRSLNDYSPEEFMSLMGEIV